MKRNKRLKSIMSLILSILLLLPSVRVYATDSKEEFIKSIQDEVDHLKNQEINDNVSEEIFQNEGVIVDEETMTNSEITVDGKISDGKGNVGELYEKVDYAVPYSYGDSKFEREELQLKYENIYNETRLLNKTEDNYEVALAYSDGSYSFIDSANSIEEAKEKALEEEKKRINGDTIPVILNNNGQVVYATFAMGRILKHINGAPDPTFSNNTYVYTSSSLGSEYTYVNHGYVDDVPVIEDIGSAAKVQISGYTGWVKKDVSSSEYDLLIVPINQVSNPSYYINKDGVLYHFISSDLTNSSQKGYLIKLGVAPSYLKEGVKYLSYDGNYFYDGSDISLGLTNLISDLRNNVKNNSINKNEPYHTYFNYLPFRSTTTYTAEDLNKFISANTDSSSKLINTGQYFINAQEKYGVNALLALGIAINESGWGKSTIAQTKNNLFGMNAVDSSPGESANYYKSVELCINEFAKYYISRGYADPADWRYYGGFLGNKINGANVKYASDPFWGEKASAHAFIADLYLSNNNVTNLNDYDALTVIKYIGENSVIDKNKKLLYNISTSINSATACINSVSVVTDKNVKLIDGKYYLEIYPDRTSYIGNGGSANKFQGEYSFNDKAYVENKNIVFINASKTDILPIDPSSANSWKEYNGNKYYYDKNGVLTRGWKLIEGYWYYFDTNTAAMKRGWLSYNGQWYYLNQDGKMQTGWQGIEGTWYYFLSSGEAKTSWLNENGKWYYFNSDCKMQIGWQGIAGTWYYFLSSGEAKTGWLNENGKWYYFNSDCKMQTGWQKLAGTWYYFISSGEAKTGWLNDNGKWYYFNSDCKMQIGWQGIEGTWYYFLSSGEAKTGWLNENGKWYYFNSDCKMQIGWQGIAGTWYYFLSSGEAKTGWLNENGKWYYFNSDCKMQTGWIKVDGKKYYLYSDGSMAVNTTINGIYLGSDGAATR